MDSFIDKFAQRRNAQEIIKANAAAEAQENERLNAKVSDYEKAMQEIRKLNLQNVENAEKVRDMLNMSLKKIEDIQTKDAEDAQKNFAEAAEQIKAQLAEQSTAISDMIKEAEDYIHREDVKVYRNVQAVIQEELPKQTDELKNAMADATADSKTPKALLPIGIFAMLFALADLVVMILQMLHIV